MQIKTTISTETLIKSVTLVETNTSPSSLLVVTESGNRLIYDIQTGQLIDLLEGDITYYLKSTNSLVAGWSEYSPRDVLVSNADSGGVVFKVKIPATVSCVRFLSDYLVIGSESGHIFFKSLANESQLICRLPTGQSIAGLDWIGGNHFVISTPKEVLIATLRFKSSRLNANVTLHFRDRRNEDDVAIVGLSTAPNSPYCVVGWSDGLIQVLYLPQFVASNDEDAWVEVTTGGYSEISLQND